MFKNSVRCFALSLSCGLLGACGADKPSSDPSPVTGLASNTAVATAKTAPPVASAVASAMGTTTMAPAQPMKMVRPVTVSGVQFDEALSTACKIDKTKAYFEYDSADLKGADMGGLDAVAECFGKGALKGKTVEIVGHADERGDADYNKALGHSRAQSVADYLASKGVDKARIKATSKGEEKAMAKPADKPADKLAADQALAADRRVDVRIAK